MILFDDGSGTTHNIGGRGDMINALGLGNNGLTIAMVDESGQLVGLGNGSDALLRSVPIIRSARNVKPLVKSFTQETPTKTEPKIMFKKPIKSSLSELSRNIADLQKAMNIGISIDDRENNNDVWDVISYFDKRLATLESTVKQLSDFVSS